MKPNFALSLSFDGIRLLQRAAGGWHMLGDVAVSDPALGDALATLRQNGEDRGDGPIRTKLIIPDEQIRYLTIHTPDMDDAARKEAARAALDGATPYPVDRLTFDISPNGDTTHIAAVARETLQEAEGFALQHGFAPLSFVAAGTGADFLGEPFFGPTDHAATLLVPGTQVEPDGVRVAIVENPAEVEQPVGVVAEALEPVGAAAPLPKAPDNDDVPENAAPTDTTGIMAADSQDSAADAPEPDDAQPKDAPEATTPSLLGFATRRQQTPSSDAPALSLGGVSRGDNWGAKAPPLGAPAPTDDEINLTAPPRSASDSLRPSDPRHGAATAPTGAPNNKPRMGGFLSRRKAPRAGQATTAGRDPGAQESERMTVFGARGDGAIRRKPRYLGLVLTAVLLVILAGVAAWASAFLEDGLSGLFPARERTLASTLPDEVRDSLAEDVGATTNFEPEAEEDGIIVAALNESLTEDAGLSAEDAAVLDALRDPLPDPVAPEELDAAALEARYAVTGIWPKAPDLPTPTGLVKIDDLYVTGIDPVSPALDAVALPRAASFATDRQLALVTSPAAAGTNFARDAQGRIIPAVEGALSPDGFTVFLGRPPLVPPATRARLDAGEDVTPDTTALAQVRPRNRPDDLVERNERATYGGLSRTELAALRPRLRPQAQQDLRAAEQAAIDDAVSDALDSADETPPADLAAAMSLRPKTRPTNFARIVARATPTPAPEADAPSTASVAPRSVTPAIPSTASVTREATVRNALNLRRVNLIGVYGTPSDRRALIRLPNGRYQKVEVGDRFDGGRVSAIGESELRYLKGGRNLILTMPSG